MDKKRKLLKTHQNDIVQDLDPTYILDHLYTNNAISNEEFERIFNLKDRVDRTRYLLSLVQNGNSNTFDVFVDSLSKDYYWLYEKLNTDNMNSNLNESFEDCLSRGDVPRLPEYYVQRTALEQEVTTKLTALTRHKILVLHGMSGCGKTSVLIGALRHNPALVTDALSGALFWLNLGNVKTDDDIICQQIKLYRKTSQYRRRGSTLMASSISMSSICSNTDSQSLSSGDWCWQDLRDRLKAVFQDENLKDALLILDEVNEKKFVEAFDIGCKILITTRDTEVVANLQPQIIKVLNHFEEEESLRLFATCLDVPLSQIPTSKAKKLHAICKGCPFHIALIGAQLAENRERLLHDNKRWDYYIDKLKKKDLMYIFQRGSDQCDPMKPIEICVNSLESSTLQMFKKLAVLPDNVKVTSKVLSYLWDKDIGKVESVLKQLKGKSLIYENYEHEQKNYSYEIHDLITNYLRRNMTQDEINKIHYEFLKNYGYVSVDKLPIELRDDGYIPYYIGYHIENTQRSDKGLIFNKLYLNLKFLGNKVRLTGPADVIMDFQKYGHSICRDKIDEGLIRCITEYLSKHGNDLYRYPHTDIVQSILQYENRGVLFQKAHQVAHEACVNRQLYFEFLHEQNVNDDEKMKHSVDIDVKQNISSVCFLFDYIIVGTEKGTIKIFYIYTNKLKKELHQCGARVISLSACGVDTLRLGALDSLGVVHLWYLDELVEPLDDDTERAGSEIEENEYDNTFTDGYTPIKPTVGRFLSFSWANNSEKLVTHTSKLAVIYGPDGLPLHIIDIFDREINIICCVFSNDDSTIIAAYELKNLFYIDVIKWESNERILTLEESDRILNLICVPVFTGNITSILVIHDTEVRRYEWKSSNKHKNNYNTYKSERIISNKEIKDGVRFIAAAVNKAGTLLFVSTNDSRVICVDLNSNSYFELDNIRGDVVTMAVSIVEAEELTPGCDVLATGTGRVEHSVKLWYCDTNYVTRATHPHRKVRLTTKFDVSFVNVSTPKPCESPSSDLQSNSTTPKRHQSFVIKEEKKLAKKTLSLDRHALKPLNLKGISHGNDECGGIQPLLAVVDDRNNIQIMRGLKTLAEITIGYDDEITTIRISPCNQYVVYGLHSGTVKQYAIKTKENKTLMDVYSRIQYLNFVNQNLLIAFGKSRCMMAYRYNFDGDCTLVMLQNGDSYLGSQEILNDITGSKKKTSQSGSLSSSGSEASISKERQFPCSDGRGRLSKGSSLVQCFWVQNIGMLSIEDNATIKLWDKNLKLDTVLNGRQSGVYINCAAFQKNVLVICDEYGKFQTFELRRKANELVNKTYTTSLRTIQEYKLNNKIMSCDLTQDGLLLAMGLDSGAIVVWNVLAKTQLALLKIHKSQSPVQACMFSPLPERIYRSSTNTPTVNQGFSFPNNNEQDYEVPLVLVTMAAEILWWDVSYLMKIRNTKRAFGRNRGRNVLSSPLTSPIVPQSELTGDLENLNISNSNHFFGNGYSKTDSWENLWRRKTYKEGSTKKEILACIKLSGINAKKLCVDENFSCFVTIDNPGLIHIMNVMKPNCSS